MTACALRNGLSSETEIVHVPVARDGDCDYIYGGVTSPTAYDFLYRLGLDEATLFTQSNTSFSLGQHYQNWPSKTGGWFQSHALPFEVWEGVRFHQFVLAAGGDLQAYDVANVAAMRGVFAHPPSDPKIPLSRAEYGYQFDAQEWVEILKKTATYLRIKTTSGNLKSVEVDGQSIRAITTTQGESVVADLWVDCTDFDRRLIGRCGEPFVSEKTVFAANNNEPTERLGVPFKSISATSSGWASRTHLVNQNAVTTLYTSDLLAADSSGKTITTGRIANPWSGNCVSLGFAASVFVPITTAPMIMLQRDIQRLLGLIPNRETMRTEARLFNENFDADYRNVSRFDKIVQNADAPLEDSGLRRKVAQFENRGTSVVFDGDPYNEEDWLTLMFGLGLLAKHHDPLTRKLPLEIVKTRLKKQKTDIEHMVARMPLHHIYVANFRKYLEKKNHA